jgi:rhamnosyltransferase
LSSPRASIVVLTANAGPTFGALLEKLREQEAGFDYEILVIDSGSTDGTVALSRRYGARVHRIPPDEFDHGGTRNLALALSDAEYLAFVVQDAVPLSEHWLAAMVENLDADERVAGVYGRQVPNPDSSPLTRALVNGWPTAGRERREQYAGPTTRYDALAPAERRSLASFDNVSSCVRRSVLEEMPFERTVFGEDLRWGKRVVEAGYKLVYEPRSAVFHSHERGTLYDLRRHYVEGCLLLDLFGLTSTPSLALLFLNALRSSVDLYLRMRRDEKEASLGASRLALPAARHAAISQTGAYLAAKNRWLAGRAPKISAKLDLLLRRGI